MTSPFDQVCVKQEYYEDFTQYSSQDFWDYEFAVEDYHEDASTQTDSFTVCKSVSSFPIADTPELPGTKVKTDFPESPPLRKANHCHRNKTPNTIKMLMEKHRENERLRHHCLNKQLHMICKIVPGFAEEGKETKVVMMQRIISYIAYLENSIKHLTSELNIQSDPTCFLLMKGIKDMNWSGLSVPSISEDSRDSEVSTMSMSRRLKLTSPTIDSMTDCASQESLAISSSSILTSQTNSQASSDGSIKMEYDNPKGDVDWVLSLDNNAQDHFNSIFGDLAFDQSSFAVTTLSLEEGLTNMETLEVEWLGSPDTCLKEMKQTVDEISIVNELDNDKKAGKGENFGIKLDPDFLVEPVNEFSHADIVSPDQVLPQAPIKKEVIGQDDMLYNQEHDYFHDGPTQDSLLGMIPCEGSSKEDCQVVPHPSKRKQLTPKRTPFVNMVNLSDLPEGMMYIPLMEAEDIKQNVNTDIPMASNFLEVESSHEEGGNEENPREALNKIREKVLGEASRVASSTKLDLRKSSWLNGFMMYSRVHRRKFIRENPGVHTAQISKMMGHAWRQMSSEQQHLYKEHAKLCSQELHRVFDSKLDKP